MTTAAVRALVPIADGSEDIESSCIIDVFRRAKWDVCVAAVAREGRTQVKLARGMNVIADAHISDCVGKDYDVVALPGGMPGAEHLRDSPELLALMKEQREKGRFIAAVCASPAVVLAHHGFLDASTAATCHANFVDRLPNKEKVESRVVVDSERKIITSRGPGTSLEFALQCVAAVESKEAAEAVAKPMHMAPFELQ